MSKEICKVEGCGKFVKGRGLCNKHYLAEYRRGTLNGQTRTERALAFVRLCLSSSSDDCLEPDFKSRSDYPCAVVNGIDYKLGWLVLEGTVGPRPSPRHVMRHVICGNSRCCNPRHICWGTEKQNAADRKRHGTEPDRRGIKNPNYRHGRRVT